MSNPAAGAEILAGGTSGDAADSPTEDVPAVASVLLVDDRVENLIALEAILEPLGLELVRATSADEALRAVLHHQFAVILLDVRMPGTDGIETARLIKQRTRSEHVPIIFLTALDRDRRYVSLGYESGAVDYLFKPVDPEVLRAKVSAFVELARLRDQVTEQKARRFADLALRESEERYRLVQQATNDVIWDWNLMTSGLRWNELARRVFRIPPTSELPDDVHWWHEHIHPDDRERVRTGIQAVIDAAAGTEWSDEYRFQLGDGSYRTFLDRGYVARDERGRPIRMIGAMQDVTERVRAREAARAAQVAAEEASRLKSEFLATMSHEFRTPLNAIVGYAQLLEMGVLGPATAAQHAHLERLQASARHLLRLVDDVLDLAKIDADRVDVRHDTLFTGTVIAAAIMLVQPQATAKGVRLVDRTAGHPGVPFTGDEHRVRQVLINLIANAVKFTPPGGQVTVSSDISQDSPSADGERGPHARVMVQDTGPGVPAEHLEKIFEPFVQGDAALTREQGGTGLGLAISRRLARLMGGDITVDGQRSGGSSFILWLPAAAPAESANDPRQRPEGMRRAAAGTPEASDAVDAPLDADSYPVLHALATRLAAEAETVAERYVTALRADGRFPGALDLPAVQLRDHATPFVGLLASQLTVIGETRGQAPELLADGGQVQRLMGELHGAQRHRLGWSEADILRETPLLFAEIERVLRDALSTPRTDDADTAGATERISISPKAVEVALRYALDVTRHVLDQGTRTAVRAFREAKSADTP